MDDLDLTQSYSYRGVRFLRSAASRAGSLVLAPPRYAATRLVPDRVRGWMPSVLFREGAGDGAAGGMSGLGGSAGSAATAAASGAAEGAGTAGAQGAADAAAYVLPAPITFLTSPYLLVSIGLGFFLHRVHHLVPPRDAISPTAAQRQGVRQRGLERVLSLPVQLGVRIPALLLVLRACVALALAIAINKGWTDAAWLAKDAEVGVMGGIAKICAQMLVWSTAWAGKGALGKLVSSGDASSALEHSSLLWQTYVAVAVSMTCENFVRSLADDLPSPSHMNLLSFAFLLHINSYGTTGAGTGIKGSTQTYLYLLICLLEILTLQASYALPAIRLAYSRQPIALQQRRRILTARSSRLAITAFYSFVGQAFAMRAWAHLFGFVRAGSTEDVEEVIAGPVWLNKLPEVVFEVVVGLSVALKLAAALIRGEELTFNNLVGQPATAPSPDEDYAIALVKYTTHILSSTRLSGLAYELSPLEVLPLSISTTLESIGFIDPPPCDDFECPVHGAENREKERKRRDARSETGEVILRRNGEVVIFDRVGTSGGSVIKRRRVAGEAVERGFEREIGRVVVEPNRSELLPRLEYHEALDEALDRDFEVEQDLVGGSRRIVWRRFWRVLFRVGFYVVYRVLRAVKVGVAKVTGWGRDEGAMQDGWRVQARGRSRSCTPAPQGREGEDDEDDEDYSPEESDDEEDLAIMQVHGRAGDVREEMHSEEAEDEVDPMTLFSDLSTAATRSSANAPTPEELAPYLLAHHLSGSSTPLTRRRYRALLPSSSSNSPSPGPSNSLAALSTAISQLRNEVVESAPHGDVERWMEEKREEWRESRSRFCVVCTVEERTIVLWPCRCLCLCDSCRTTLSERSTIASLDNADAAGGTGRGNALCPTCRTPVQGFSRIFVP